MLTTQSHLKSDDDETVMKDRTFRESLRNISMREFADITQRNSSHWVYQNRFERILNKLKQINGLYEE